MLRLACVLSLVLGCSVEDPDEQGEVEELVISNGVDIMPGVDPDRVTTLSAARTVASTESTGTAASGVLAVLA